MMNYDNHIEYIVSFRHFCCVFYLIENTGNRKMRKERGLV